MREDGISFISNYSIYQNIISIESNSTSDRFSDVVYIRYSSQVMSHLLVRTLASKLTRARDGDARDNDSQHSNMLITHQQLMRDEHSQTTDYHTLTHELCII